ncbi:CTP synthase, partial [Acinetobacter baumannii]
GLDDYVCKHFGIEVPEADMSEWEELINVVRYLEGDVNIALVGKYVALPDAYLSVVEALKHAGYHYGKKVKIK